MPKKKTALTIEERLQQALVPAEEQPYELPENWVWCRLLDSVNNCLDNYRKPVNSTERANRIGNIPYYGATGQVGWIDDYLTNEHLVLLGEDGAPFLDLLKEKAYIIFGKAWVNNHAHILKSKLGEIGNLFLKHYLNTVDYKDYVKGTTRLKLTQGSMMLMPFPLPPLAEQQRIVDRIEELFAKLDEAKEKLEAVMDSFAVRKAAILHKAFTGELTQRWRKENGVELSSWKEKSINEICSSLKYGTSKKSSDIGDVIVLRMGNLQNGEIDWNNLAYTNDKDDIEKYYLKSGDVLFNRTNSPDLVGKTSIYRGEYPAIYAGYLIKLDYEPSKIIGDFLNYYLNSPIAKEYYMQVKTDGVSQSNINAKKIGEFLTPLPTLPEQHEIVRRIDSLLARERKAQEAAEQALTSIELMKKAILAKAFRGELGTNRASEASAMELLRQVLAEEK